MYAVAPFTFMLYMLHCRNLFFASISVQLCILHTLNNFNGYYYGIVVLAMQFALLFYILPKKLCKNEHQASNALYLILFSYLYQRYSICRNY
jgi:hypothetical protein